MTELGIEEFDDLDEVDEFEPEEDQVVEVDLELPEPEEVQEYVPVEFTNLDVVVDEIIAGQWGNGQDRRRRLEEAGYSHALVQKELVRRMNHR